MIENPRQCMRRSSRLLIGCLTLAAMGILLNACVGGHSKSASAKPTAPEPNRLPRSSEEVRPLSPGSAAPKATVRDPDGRPVDLHRVLGRAPTLVLFYRGGW